MNFKKLILLSLILGIFVSPAKNIHSMNFLKRNYKTIIGFGVSAYLLYKYFKKEKTNTIDITPTNHLSHTPITEDFLHRTLESSSLHPNILNSQGLTEGIRDNILGNLTKYSCMQKFKHENWAWKFCPLNSLCQLPNGNLVSGSRGGKWNPDFGTIKIWDINTGECLKDLTGHCGDVWQLCILPNGYLASCAQDYTIKIWDISNCVCVKTLRGHEHPFVSAIFTLSNGNIASSAGDFRIKIWDSKTGECLRTFQGHDNWVHSLCVLPNGNLASGSADQTIKIWDVSTGECLKTLEDHTASVKSICVLHDGNLASGSFDRTIKIWNTDTGECVRTLEGHNGSVNTLCVLQNGNLVSGSSDGTIKIWNINTGECLQTLAAGCIFSLCTLSNGMFASGSYYGGIKIWGNSFDIAI